MSGAPWRLVVLALVVAETGAASTPSVKLCGRKLGDMMARVCKVYNSPAWDVPQVVEQPVALVRRRRSPGGIADECCTLGCTYHQLAEYCSVSDDSDLLEGLETHFIEDRSAEGAGGEGDVSSPAAVRREVGGGRRRRCGCRRARRRSPSRRHGPAGAARGNMAHDMSRIVSRAAPVVGTVSPLLTWGRTVNTDLPRAPRDHYVAVYTI